MFFLFAVASAEQDAEKKVLRLSIRDAIRIAVEKNLFLKLESMEPEIRKTDIEIGEAEFDPKFFSGVYLRRDMRQSASAFASPEVGDVKEKEWNLGVGQKLKLGTEYDITLKSNIRDTNSPFAGLDPQYDTELTLNLTQPLLKGRGSDINAAQILIAKNNKGISDTQFTQSLIDIIAEVQNAYWELVYARENLKVKEESLNLAKDFEKRIRAQVKVGTLAPIEILQAQAEVAAREEDVIMAKNDLEKANDSLKEIMNISDDLYDWGGPIEPLDQPSFVVEKADLKGKIAKALEKRPDIQEMKIALANENIRIKYKKNQLYPTLDLVGSLGLNGISGKAKLVERSNSISSFGGGYGKDFKRMLSGDYSSWKIGINIEYPIGNRSAKNELMASQLRVRKILYQLKDLEKKIALEVRNAVREIETNIKRVESTRISKQLAKEKLEAEEKKFAAGLSTSFNVLSYQEDLTVQETGEIQAIIDYNHSLVNLQSTVAETLEVLDIKVQKEIEP